MSRKLKLNEIENSFENNAVYVIEYDEQHNIEYKTLSLYYATEEIDHEITLCFSDSHGELWGYSASTYGKKWDCEASNACAYDDEPMTKEILQRTGEALSFPNASAIVLTKHGADDWEVYFPDIDYSVRGMKKDIMEEISTYCE